MFITEEEWTIIALWTVEIFFEIISWWERNPVWSAVFSWASTAILVKNVQEKPGNIALMANVGVIDGIHLFSVVLLASYLIFEELQPWYVPFSFWNGGIFGLVDWSLAFSQIK